MISSEIPEYEGGSLVLLGSLLLAGSSVMLEGLSAMSPGMLALVVLKVVVVMTLEGSLGLGVSERRKGL
jgi:hypothetical protein